jgi:hypothetical protein
MSESAVHLTRRQVIDFRLVRHGLVKRLGPDGAQAAAVVGLQDAPPGTAALALAARADVAPEALDELVLAPSIRGAPLAVAERDLGVFTAGSNRRTRKRPRRWVGNAWRSLDGIGAMEALDRISETVYESLRDGPRARDDFHQALRERLPDELLWWCKGCGSHHVHPSLWRATVIRGVLAIVGREGRSAVFGLPPKAGTLKDAGAELARRFVRAYGPARRKLLADWAGLTTSHATALWERAKRSPSACACFRTSIRSTPAVTATCSCPTPPCASDSGRRSAGPGTVLVAGEVAGLWRPAKKGRKRLITVEPLGKLTSAATDELAGEIERLAPFRGADSGDLRLAAP